MMAGIVDQDRFAALYRSGLTRRKIAREVGCHEAYVSVLARKLGLGPRRVKASAAPAGAAVDRPLKHPILATEGRYAALADYAREHGLTSADAQRLWHQWRRAK